MKVIVQDEWFSIEQCDANPMNIYVFGDNLQRVGNGGQAQIRPCKNTFGVATKRSPSMAEDAFFDDTFNDYIMMNMDLFRLYTMMNTPEAKNCTLVFPVDGLGTGLSELPKHSPFINEQLKELLQQYFNVLTRIDGTLCYLKP